jgi:hypothetical protein
VVLGDVIDARQPVEGAHGSIGSFGRAHIGRRRNVGEYLLSLDVADRPGVLHAVTGTAATTSASVPPSRRATV